MREELPKSSLKAIENIAIGDFVSAWDHVRARPVSGQVVRLFRNKAKPVLDITLAVGDRQERITVTTEHPFWVEEKGWTEASNLRAGDRLKQKRPGDERVVVLSVCDSGMPADVFNFEVAGLHNYFVGQAGVLVHNVSKSASPAQIAALQKLIAERGLDKLAPVPGVREVAAAPLGGLEQLNQYRESVEGSRVAKQSPSSADRPPPSSKPAGEESAPWALRSEALADRPELQRAIPSMEVSGLSAPFDPVADVPGFSHRDGIDVPPTLRTPWDPIAHASDGMGRRFDVVNSGEWASKSSDIAAKAKFNDLSPVREAILTREASEGVNVWNFDPVERMKYRVFVRDGLVYKSNGELFDTRSAPETFHNWGGGRAIFAMGAEGDIYASNYQVNGKLHHSSFLAGAPVAAAGEIEVHDGVVKLVDRHSGHYWPSESQLDTFGDYLESLGVSPFQRKYNI